MNRNIDYPIYFKSSVDVTKFIQPNSGIEISKYSIKPTVLDVDWYILNCKLSSKQEFKNALYETRKNLTEMFTRAEFVSELEERQEKQEKQREYEVLLGLITPLEVDKMQEAQDFDDRTHNYFEDDLYETI